MSKEKHFLNVLPKKNNKEMSDLQAKQCKLHSIKYKELFGVKMAFCV